jgi:hypothetical protein
MIADALTRMPFRTPAEATAIALAAAQRRLPIGQPASRMDGQTAIVRAIETDGLSVSVLVEFADGTVAREAAGFWIGRAEL